MKRLALLCAAAMLGASCSTPPVEQKVDVPMGTQAKQSIVKNGNIFTFKVSDAEKSFTTYVENGRAFKIRRENLVTGTAVENRIDMLEGILHIDAKTSQSITQDGDTTLFNTTYENQKGEKIALTTTIKDSELIKTKEEIIKPAKKKTDEKSVDELLTAGIGVENGKTAAKDKDTPKEKAK